VITNTDRRSFDVVEITNEMPVHRNGGVGTVIEGLMSGLAREGLDVLWFVTDHGYSREQVDQILRRFPRVAVGDGDDLRHFDARVVHLHAYQENRDLEARLAGWQSVYTVHSLLALEETSNDVNLASAVRGRRGSSPAVTGWSSSPRLSDGATWNWATNGSIRGCT